MAVVRVISKDGKLLAPTTRCDHVRHLLKDGKAEVVGKEPFTIRLLTDEKNYFTSYDKKGTKTMSKAKRKNIVIVVAMVAVLAIGSISAYFTATDSNTNTFTVGNVNIDQKENGTDTSVVIDDMTPNQEVDKAVTVVNTGDNDAYVYTVVAVPKKVVKVTKVDGSAPATGDGVKPGIDGTEQLTQLFQLNATEDGTKTMGAAKINSAIIGKTTTGVLANDAKGMTADMPTKSVFTTAQPALESSNANAWTGVDSWNDNWYLLDVNNTLADVDNATGANALASHLNDYNVYLFAYGTNSAMTKLTKEAVTPALFETVTMANVVNINDLLGLSDEDTIDYNANVENAIPQMLVKTFAIQADQITSNGSDPAPATDPAAVWRVLNNQDGAYRAVADELTDMDATNNAWQARAVNSAH